MQFEESGNKQHPYRIIFEGDEIDTVKAVFREEMYRHAQKGNVSSISDYDITMADWDDTKPTLPTLLAKPESMVERLEEFHESTDDAIMDLGQNYGVAPFLSDEIILRRRMGLHALELANSLRIEMTKGLHNIDIDALDLDAELTGLIEDKNPPID